MDEAKRLKAAEWGRKGKAVQVGRRRVELDHAWLERRDAQAAALGEKPKRERKVRLRVGEDELKPLTQRQRMLLNYFLGGKDSGEAYRLSYRVVEGRDRHQVLMDKGRRVLEMPHVRRALREAQQMGDVAVAEVVNRYVLSRQRMMEELASIAFARVTDYIPKAGEGAVDFHSLPPEQQAAVSEVRYGKDRDGRPQVTVKLHNKAAAIATINQMMGWDTPEGDSPEGEANAARAEAVRREWMKWLAGHKPEPRTIEGWKEGDV